MSKPTRGIGDKWIDVCRLLNRGGVEYLVVGGVAMALHGRMRATKDIDVLVPRDVENIEIPYVGLRELIRSKRTDRDQDRVDARELEAAEARQQKARKSGQETAKENVP